MASRMGLVWHGEANRWQPRHHPQKGGETDPTRPVSPLLLRLP